MSAERDFILGEIEQIGKVLDLVDSLLSKTSLDQFETIALGTLVQNAYTGIESILRSELVGRGIQLARAENWHKDLLREAYELKLIDDAEFDCFRMLLVFRHRHIHGYGHMLDAARLGEIARAGSPVCRFFIKRLRSLFTD